MPPIESLLEPLTARAGQFGTVLLRMMPGHVSSTPEGKLVAAIFTQAWSDATNYTSARRFFTLRSGVFDRLCECCGLDASQIQALYLKHNPTHRELNRKEQANGPDHI